ncbi:MAG TPA: amino acid ABC transporter permease [Actinomycetota bacterium]|nr:amino acid ABC transporter permease [Actinomycetota bacterium]
MEAIRVRTRDWFADQVPVSLATLALGAAALGTVLLGTLALLLARGLIPHERILRTLTSEAQSGVLYASLAGGLLALVAGAVGYRRMPTRPAREAAVSGAALGAQAVVVAAFLLWFRSGETVDVFIRQFFRFEVLGEFARQFVTGAKNTVILAMAGEAIGIGIGLAVALLALSRRMAVRAPARTYINFFRGTPLLWQLSFFYFGIVLGLGLDVTAYQAAIVILGINAGAYTAEVFRAGILSIERGQMKAARSLGMSYFQAMRYAILPQAFRRVIPPLTNEFITLIKDTSLVVLLGLTFGEREILSVARDAYQETFNATPWLAGAAAYLVVTLPMIRIVTMLERRLRSGLAVIVG